MSPLPVNIYLHSVLDLWGRWWRRRQARGKVIIVRYADDFVMGFQYREDAECLLSDLRGRLTKFALEIHQAKTRLIEFGRFAIENRKKRGAGNPETFDFPGFTHICAIRRKDGKFTVRRKAIAKRMRGKLKEIKDTLVERRPDPVPQQGRWRRGVVRGCFHYVAVPGTRREPNSLRGLVNRFRFRPVRRGSQKGQNLTWKRMQRLIQTWMRCRDNGLPIRRGGKS